MSRFSHNLCSIFPIVISLVVFLPVYPFKILQWLDVFHIYHSPCISCTATSYPRLSTTRTNEPDIMSSFYCYKYKTTIPFPLFLSPIRHLVFPAQYTGTPFILSNDLFIVVTGNHQNLSRSFAINQAPFSEAKTES